MDFDKEILDKAYKPFFRQAFFDSLTQAILLLLLFLLFILLEYPEAIYIFCIGNLIYYLNVFTLPIISIFERKWHKFNKILVNVKIMETDGWLGDSHKNDNLAIAKYYPKALAVERNKLICVDEFGKKYKLRIIGSKKKMDKMRKIFIYNKEKIFFIYGKYTKIIIWIEHPDKKNNTYYFPVKSLNKQF